MPEGKPQDELSSALKGLRKAAGLSGEKAGQLTGMSQASISRYESGKQVPGPDEVTALCRLYGAPSAQRHRLESLAADLWSDASPQARAVRKRSADMQRRIGRIEQASNTIGVFQPVVVPGILQTAAYAQALFVAGDVADPDAAVEARLSRQEHLDDPSKRFTLIMAEGAPRWTLGSPSVMSAQLDRIIELSMRPNIDVGIVRTGDVAEVVPMTGFDVYDERAAVVGTNTATTFFTELADVTFFVQLFRRVTAAATFDNDARAVLRAIQGVYHGMSS